MRWYCFFLILLLIGCGTARKIKTGAAGIDVETLSPANKKVFDKAVWLMSEEKSLNFNTFSARAKIEYEDHYGKQPEANVSIRMAKDSFIWVSITATVLNIEAARVWMTPDSVIIVNRLEKTVEQYPLDYIRQVISLPLTFRDIQALIAGKAVLAGDSVVSVATTDNFLLVTSRSPGIENQTYFMLRGPLLARQTIAVAEGVNDYTAEILYENYEKKGKQTFSTLRDISVPSGQQKLRLSFRQYEFNNELSVPFSRPQGYTIK